MAQPGNPVYVSQPSNAIDRTVVRDLSRIVASLGATASDVLIVDPTQPVGIAVIDGSGKAPGDVLGVDAFGDPGFAAVTIAVVTGLQTALDGKQPLATVLTNTTAAFTSAQETKLSGIATGATANAADASLRDRTTHTGAQAIATVTELQTALDGKAAVAHTHAASDINAGTLATARLGSGEANSTTYLRGDQTWQVPPSGGAVALAYVNQDLGSAPAKSGTFTVPIASSTVGSLIEMFETAETLPSGETADRLECDHATVFGIVTASTTATCYWNAGPGYLAGVRRFAYRITGV